MNGMMRSWRLLVLVYGTLLWQEVVVASPPPYLISYSTASSGDDMPGGSTPVDSYQEEEYYFTGYSPELRGLFMLKGGFNLSVDDGHAYWNAHGIVDGPMTFNGSTLHLLSHLYLGPNAQLDQVAQTILSPKDSRDDNIPKTIFLSGDMLMTQDIYSYTDFALDGNWHTLTIGGIHPSIRVPADTSSFSNVILNCTRPSYQIEANNGIFSLGADVYLSNVKILSAPPEGDFTQFGNNGDYYTLRLSGDVDIEGFGNRVDFGGTVEVLQGAKIEIKPNTTLTIGPGVILTGVQEIFMNDKTSVLHLKGCDFYVGANGLNIKKGTIILEDKVRIFNINYGDDPLNPNTDMNKGFILGDGTNPANDVNVVVCGGASVIVDGCMWYNNA